MEDRSYLADAVGGEGCCRVAVTEGPADFKWRGERRSRHTISSNSVDPACRIKLDFMLDVTRQMPYMSQ